MKNDLSRRTFVKAGALMATGLATSRAYGANDRVRFAFIGVGNRGGQLIGAACNHADMEAAAVCDVYAPYRDKWAEQLKCPAYADWREIIDRKDIDAVVIAAPDHWHALMTIAACRAGKDVYCEKPMSYTIREGRRMVDVRARDQARRADWHTAPVVPDVCATGRAHPRGQGRQSNGVARIPHQQHGAERNGRRAGHEASCGPGLGHVARAEARSSV